LENKPRLGTSINRKMHAMQRRHKSPFKDHSEYVAKCLNVHVHAVLSQLWASFAEKTKKLVNNKNKNLLKIRDFLSLKNK